ncbi:MAG TPA: RluA family pseudouridine synthase [Usitatibacteraceae bacterium]|nr:RluA family pseudouridine synthase [Usitatibacteraceae bacterium]
MATVDFEDEDYSPADLDPPLAAPARTMQLEIPAALAGKRLDQALAELIPGYSRSRLTTFIREGFVTVDDLPGSGKQRLCGGERVNVTTTPRAEESAFQAEAVPFPVIHEDDAVIVIDKPAGLVVHPAAGNWSGTLLNGLLHHDPHLARLPRAGIVHRLDKDTSGVMVVARTEAAQVALVRQLQERTMSRTYLALVRGHLTGEGRIEAAIGRHPHQRTRMAVRRDDPRAKPAATRYRVVECTAFHTLVECTLETGRTHQIRVHMQSAGFPLEGDPVYGPPMTGIDPGVRATIRAFGRQALHARRLAFVHPVSGQKVGYEAPIPADLRDFIAAMRELG